MKVKDLIELLDGCNPNYEVALDIKGYVLGDSYVSDYDSQTMYLELIPPPKEIKDEKAISNFTPSNYIKSRVDIHG